MKGKKPKSEMFTMRTSSEHKAILKQYADSHGMDLASFVRQSAFQASEISPFLNDEDTLLIEVLQEDLRKIGINLNQITRAINAGHYVSAEDISKRVDAVKTIVEFTQVTFAECLTVAARRQRSAKVDV